MSYYVWYLWYYRLEAEVDEVVGKKSFISYDDITKFTYMTTLIKETLRVHPPITIIMRNTAADSEVDGLHIPAKTNIMVLFINTFTCMLQTMRFNAKQAQICIVMQFIQTQTMLTAEYSGANWHANLYFNTHWTTMQFNDKTWLLWFSLKLKYNSCDNITDVTAITHKKKQVRKQTETKPAMCTILNNGNILQL